MTTHTYTDSSLAPNEQLEIRGWAFSANVAKVG